MILFEFLMFPFIENSILKLDNIFKMFGTIVKKILNKID